MESEQEADAGTSAGSQVEATSLDRSPAGKGAAAGTCAGSDPRVPCLLLVVVALACRLVLSASAGVYVDEAYVYFLGCGSLADMLTGARPDLNPPTYSMLMHAFFSWSEGWGREPLLLRLPSIVCGVGVVPFVYLIGRRVHGEAVAWWASALVAVAYACVLSDSQIRFYGLLGLLSAVALWGRLEAEERGAPPGGWVLHGLACLVLAVTHYLGAAVVAALLLGAPWSRRRWPLVASYLPGLAGCFAWVVYSLTGPTHSDTGSRFLGPTSGLTFQVFHTPGFLLGLLIPVQWPPAWNALGMTPVVLQWLTTALDLGAWVAFFAGVRALVAHKRSSGIVVALFVLFPLLALTLGASLGLQPYQHRYAVVFAGAWFLLVAAGLLRWRAKGVLGVVVGTNLVLAVLAPTQPFLWNQDWRTCVEFVERRQQPGDAMVVYLPYSLMGFNFSYQGGLLRADFSQPGALAFRYPPGYRGVDQVPILPRLLGPGLERQLGSRRVFLVLNQEDAVGGRAIREWFGTRYGMVDVLEQRGLHSWGNASTYLLVPRPREAPPAP